MAKLSSTNNLILLGIGGIALYFLLRPSNRPPQNFLGNYGYYPQFPQVPPAPPNNSPQWAIWANAVIDIFGNAAELWLPGGPFHNQSSSAVTTARQNPQFTGDMWIEDWAYGLT